MHILTTDSLQGQFIFLKFHEEQERNVYKIRAVYM